MRRIIVWRDAHCQFLPLTIHLHRHRNSAVIRTNRIHHLLPRRNRLTVDCDNAVIRHQPGIRRRVIREHRTENGGRIWRLHAGKEKDSKKQHNGQDDVHCRTRQNHNHT